MLEPLEKSPYALGLVAIVAVCVYVAFEHFFIASRRRDLKFEFWFGALLLIYAGIGTIIFLVVRNIFSTSDSVQNLLWLQFLLQIILIMAATFFVRAFTAANRNVLYFVIQGGSLILLALHVILPDGFAIKEYYGMDAITLPWGESIFTLHYAQSPLALVFIGIGVLFVFWSSQCILMLHKTRRIRQAYVLFFSLAIALISLVLGFWQYPYGQHHINPVMFTLLGVLLFVNLIITDELAESSLLAKRIEHKETENHQLSSSLDLKITEVDTLLSVISLDLRSPLVNVLGFSEDLLDHLDHSAQTLQKVVPDEQQRIEVLNYINAQFRPSLSYVHRGATRLRHMLDAIQTVSRLDRSPLRTEPCALYDLVQKSLDTLRPALEQCKATLHIATLPFCLGDREQIQLVLQQILENAIAFRSAHRQLHIEISEKPHPLPEHARWVILGIHDNGIGFAPHRGSQLFNLFHRENPQMDSVGLGLYLARRALWRMEGEIWAESDGQTGATFWVALPSAHRRDEPAG